ncbi:uncharacterized protein LOC116248712 [Nymphaea colorata]|nr:uncharacterized protein LOC116248712 [Nymphaea colorata]
MAGGTGEAESRPSMASPMAFLRSTCSCFELVVRGVWGCLVYHLGFGEDCTDGRSKKGEHEQEEDGTTTRKREVHEDQEGDETKTRKKEEVGQTETRNSEEPEEEDETKTRANGGSTENFGVMLTRGPKRPGIDVGGGGQVN